VNRKTFITALGCAFLATSLLGCGGSNKLQSITLGASLVNGVAPTGGQAGFFSLQGNGGTIQLQATGTYSSAKTKDLTNKVTYNVIVDPVNNQDAFGNILLPPCQTPCQAGQGTAQFSPTGLITAVDPATCTWVDASSDPTKPAWFYVGAYQVTVTFQGITSQPIFIPVASSGGVVSVGNPNGVCDQPTS
jgi:hypothetical protein